jgi:hypothetical protein
LFRQCIRRAAIVAAAGGLTAAGIGLTAGPASASGVYNIDQWSPSSACLTAGYDYCLWKGTGKGTGGSGWGNVTTKNTVVNLDQGSDSPVFNSLYGDGYGYNYIVYNDAGSMSDGTYDCNVTVWEYANAQGDADWLEPTDGGNLTSTLANHDESINYKNCG